MKVIGTGVARTGTTSTKAALEELGFDPCYTFVTLFAKREHIDLWLAAYAGQPMDWPRLFDTEAFRELVRTGGPRPVIPTTAH